MSMLHVYVTPEESEKARKLKETEEAFDRRKAVQDEIDRDNKKKERQSS